MQIQRGKENYYEINLLIVCRLLFVFCLTENTHDNGFNDIQIIYIKINENFLVWEFNAIQRSLFEITLSLACDFLIKGRR